MIGGSNAMWSAQETADYLGINYKTLLRQWRTWGMTGYQVGQQIKFRGRDVEAWLEKNKAE